MLHASEIEPVPPGLCLWRFYDPSVKADLFSTSIQTASGTYLVDPIPLAPDGIANLEAHSKIAGIIVTNENHERAAAQFAEKFNAPIYLDGALAGATKLPGVTPVQENRFPPELTAVGIEGGAAGEIAIHYAVGNGTMIMGDALINLEPYGFALLPAKYCSNFKLMRRSLSAVLEYSFDRMLFAHGLPILSQARERLALLLKEHR